jgi:3-oxoadipate enol-lactonase
MPFAEINGINLYYETHGPKIGAAPALVFAHGTAGNGLSWWQQVPHFRERFTCVVFDHRGWGRSVDSPGGPLGAMFADDLRALLDHLGIDRATLIGQSMGGWTCLQFAVRCPARVERLAMLATHGGISTPEIDDAWRISRGLASALPPGVHPATGERMWHEQPDRHFLYTEIAATNPERAPADGVRSAGSTTPAQAGTVTAPVLFVSGEEDIVIPPRIIELAAPLFPRARIERIARAGHSAYFERPDTVNAMLDRFLTET